MKNRLDKKVTEVHEYCRIVSVSLHKDATGTFSVCYKFLTRYNKSFTACSPMPTEAAAEHITELLYRLFLRIDYEQANTCLENDWEDQFTNLVKKYVTHVDEALAHNNIKVYVDRVKDGEFWNVKCYSAKPALGSTKEPDAILVDPSQI